LDINKIILRAAKEIKNGQIVNLGIGLPTRIIEHIPADLDVIFQSENGILGTKIRDGDEAANRELIDAGGHYVTTRQGEILLIGKFPAIFHPALAAQWS